MHKFVRMLAFCVLLLSACTFQVGLAEPAQTNPTPAPVLVIPNTAQPSATPVVVLPTPIPVALPTETTVPELLYFWPAALSPELKFNSARTASNESGYRVEFDNPQTGAAIILRAGAEADRYPYCAGQTSPYPIRNVEGCSTQGTGAGAALEWQENGFHYSIGGMGSTLEALVQFSGQLTVLDYPAWQQARANAAKLDSSGPIAGSPARIRIEFVSGTTSNTSAYRELAAGGFDEYILGALKGQELAVNAAPYTFAEAENFVLSVSGADGSVLLAEAAQLHSWTGVLPATQDYVIRVKNRGNAAAQYQLNVSIPWRINFAAGATSTSLDGKLLAGNNGNLYLLRAQVGQTLTLSTTSANNAACLTVSAKMTAGGFTPLLNTMAQATTSWSTVLPTGSEYAQDYSILVLACPESPATDTPYKLFVSVTH
jgi:hypothetical protein